MKHSERSQLLVAYYGDDLTGSTDALEFLSRAGLRTMLFLDVPTAESARRYGDLDALGVAGMTRAMVPAEMSRTLDGAFSVLKSLDPRHVHYKVSSTFDSSPKVGSIGTAVTAATQVFHNPFTPVLVAAPNLGRHSAFGNLFAWMGSGDQGATYRLDRHPSMSAHAITPALESDLRLHFAQQIDQAIGLIDLLDLAQPISEITARLNAEIAAGKSIVFFDALYGSQMRLIGEVLDRKADEVSPLFSVGSSGIEKALGDYWNEQGVFTPRTTWEPLSASHPMLALSGSASPITASQIDWAVDNGFEEIEVEAQAIEAGKSDSCITAYEKRIVSYLRKGRSVVLHTAKGPDDPRIAEMRGALGGKGWDEHEIRSGTAKLLGTVLGQSAWRALTQVPVQRLVLAGGDTSSLAARELGIVAVEMVAPLFPGAPVCRAVAPGSPVHGIEVNFKGGQIGDETYFGALQKGEVL